MKKIDKVGVAFAFSIAAATAPIKTTHTDQLSSSMSDQEVLEQLSFLDLDSPEVSVEIATGCGDTHYCGEGDNGKTTDKG